MQILENYLENDALRKRRERAIERQKLCENKSLLAKKRKKEAERKRKYRQKIKSLSHEKIAVSSLELGKYKSRQTLGKAFYKAKRTLTASPSRQVTSWLWNMCHIYLKKVNRKPKIRYLTKRKIKLSNFTLEMILVGKHLGNETPNPLKIQFLVLDKFFKNVICMMMTVKEAFELFKYEYQDSKLHVSTFYDLRPKHVLLSSETPHNVCVSVSCKFYLYIRSHPRKN